MATPTELPVLLRLYTGKQNSPTVNIADFCDYLQKYARHYLQEAPELVMYLDDTLNVVLQELDKLEIAGKVQLSTDLKGRRLAFVPQYFVDRVVNRFRELDERPEIPFPLSSELPAGFPSLFIKPVHITTDFTINSDPTTDRSNTYLNQLTFPDETPPIIYPGSISREKLLDLAMGKIRAFLRKDESRDYLQKRLMVANPGKELTIKNQFVQFQTRPSESMRAFKNSGESFLFWSYLCTFIRQDFAKKTEKTPEDFALMQSVYIAEYLNNYYKNKQQQDLQRETALKNLDLAFQKPPYYFDMESITRFTDSRGVPLLGQYKDTDLENFIKERSGDTGKNTLPVLLVFKTENGNRYFILKEKVVPLVVRLCNEGRKGVKDSITKEWYQLLKEFRQEPAMKSQGEFERKLTGLCKTNLPILYSVLNATFIPLLSLEGEGTDKEAPGGFRMFDHGHLVSYADLLMLNRNQLLTDTRIMLPFWYTIPVISSIFAFFRRPRKNKAEREYANKTNKSREERIQDTGQDGAVARQQRKEELKQAVKQIEKKLIPAGSSLSGELTARLDLWNRTLDPEVKVNLTEDVNSLIRDHIRRILKTIKASNFDLPRVENLANTLVDSPGLIKIKNREALFEYVELYILQLIGNIG